MTDLSAAIGLAQLEKLEGWNERRISNAEALSRWITTVETPRVREGARHVFHQYTIRLPGDRDAFQQRLHERGIGSAVHYPIPIHQQPIMQELGFGDYSLPVTEEAARSVLSLPVHPALSEEDVEFSAATVNDVARR
jgi:dTDP-4-amino-4,6-dideoxygalactose transaminase